MPIDLMPLPFPVNSLLPQLSTQAVTQHYEGVYAHQVALLNEMITGTHYEEMALEDIITHAQDRIFEHAVEIWNHQFYWRCLRPSIGGVLSSDPKGYLEDALKSRFGDIERFKQEFTDCALKQFGSGWIWLVQRTDKSLALVATANAGTVLTGTDRPLLACDVWEHAYYPDYHNLRSDYLAAFWKLVNWEFVANQFKR